MQQPSLRQCLSENDQKVLESLFVPIELAGTYSTTEFNIETTITDVPEEQTPKVQESARLEIEGVRKAETGNVDEAISLFDQAIQVAGNRGSIYNNRAQALRLKGNDEGALNDLQKAIDLSGLQPRTRCQAFCQRGLLHRKMNNIDAARSDFEEAVKLGSQFARTQLVEINPYSALCNQMLKAAFEKLQ